MVTPLNRRTFLTASAASAGAVALTGLGAPTAGAAPTSGTSAAAVAARVRKIKVPIVAVRAKVRADLTEATLAEASTLIRRGGCTAVQMVKAHLDRIDTYDVVYQAYNARTSNSALAAAKSVDRGRRTGPLAGIR